ELVGATPRFDPGGNVLAMSGDAKMLLREKFLPPQGSEVQLWDVAGGKLLGSAQNEKATVSAAKFSPDGRTVLIGRQDGTAQLWDVAADRPLELPLNHSARIDVVAFSPDGKIALTAEGREVR